ncbi:DUF2780 domain-containing protein [Gloeobacter violaceus]|uniref:Gll2364 protein n=1 Tax=Gloeobacter violaceus (strain ATCC 29082 / PCC 7421) TaxID=251221 RepID=Q7NI20_GLOVI|nr:DUF2780 domain-containing protein [Gloeobacter violaceus]BAC90305.1 gll2364 [Gloeobacter violaceus PCC 7421]
MVSSATASPAEQIVVQIAARLGIPQSVAVSAAGVAFQFLSRQLEAGTFDTLMERFPAARGWIEQALVTEKQKEESSFLGGMVGKVAGAVGGLGGVGAAAQLFARLGQVGVPADKLDNFVPTFSNVLQENLPADLFQVIKGKLPGI